MATAIGKVFILLLVVIGAFLWVGQAVTKLTGGEKRIVAGGQVALTPEGGETIFWGKGRCFTCHSVGDRGSAVRGPNQGQFGAKFTSPIGVRSEQRAAERSKKTGKTYTRTDYLIESVAEPGAYIVEGYKNEMAVVYAPPISLNLDEIKAVLSYLQAQGGEFDIEALNNPSAITQRFYARISAATAAGGGDPKIGEEVYEENCGECHKIGGDGGEVGPDLSAIATKGLKFISDSILKPAVKITKGFETYVVVTKNGRKTTGLKTRDDSETVEITKTNGDVVKFAKSDIKEIAVDEINSLMPADLIEALTVKDFQDVLSFMMLQKGDMKGVAKK